MALDLFPRFWDAIKSQEQERASSATRLTEATDLKDVLGDEKEVTLFSEYCRSHFCEEQVLFWLEARDYKLLFDPSDMLSQGEMIFDVYVKASAELRVNISDMAAKAVEEKLNSKVVDQMLFDEVAQEVALACYIAQRSKATRLPVTSACVCAWTGARTGRDFSRVGYVATIQGSGDQWRVRPDRGQE